MLHIFANKERIILLVSVLISLSYGVFEDGDLKVEGKTKSLSHQNIPTKCNSMDETVETTSKYFNNNGVDSSTKSTDHCEKSDKSPEKIGSKQNKHSSTSGDDSDSKEKDKKSDEVNNDKQSDDNDNHKIDDDENIDIDETEPASPAVEYSEKDFYTDSEEELKEEESDNTDTDTDIMMGASSSHKKKKENEPVSKKLKQSTLNFGKAEPRSTRSKDKSKKESKRWGLTKRWSDKDTQNYRDGYPGKQDHPNLTANLKFYTGKIKSDPDGDFIDNIHEDWWGDYNLLERHHGYIQWIFPIREDGMNWQAQALQLHEAEAIKSDPKALDRVLRSYELMLDFYGMKLTDKQTGSMERSDKWRDRFDNLSWSSHNYLRITRILKSLGEFGLEHLKKPWLQFMLHEALVTRKLARTLNSCRDYWIGTLKDDADREGLYEFIEENS